MPPTLADRLAHILDAINNIQTFLSGTTAAAFSKDKLTRMAVERSLEIISEAYPVTLPHVCTRCSAPRSATAKIV